MTKERRRNLWVTIRERDTILAALRLWQERLRGHEANPISDELMEIATDGDTHAQPLSDEEVDQLLDRINC